MDRLDISEQTGISMKRFLELLDLPIEQAENLSDYLKKAAMALDINEVEVLVKMIAYAYGELAPKTGGGFNPGIGQIAVDEKFKYPWEARR